jgi:hypothetical protein
MPPPAPPVCMTDARTKDTLNEKTRIVHNIILREFAFLDISSLTKISPSLTAWFHRRHRAQDPLRRAFAELDSRY